MNVTFRNLSSDSLMILSVGNSTYPLKPESEIYIPYLNSGVSFTAEIKPVDLLEGFDEDSEGESLKERIIYKLTKKLVEKIPEIGVYTAVTYELNSDYDNVTVELTDSADAFCAGKIADFFEMMPVMYTFSKAETAFGSLKVTDVKQTNRKQYLKLFRKILLFSEWGIILPGLFFFIPKYLVLKLLSGNWYITKRIKKLYEMSSEERIGYLQKREREIDKQSENSGCLMGILKVVVFLLILGGIVFWVTTSEPEVIIAEDFSSVVCFDEVFVKTDGALPEDAEDVFLEDYTAYYPTGEDEYDSESYYCYIYETPDGERYMWLKDGCDKEENYEKDYEDYENPIVYKSIGEQTTEE